MGIDDVLKFCFISQPPKHTLLRSLESLHMLGALDDEGSITHDLGRTMVGLPLDPTLARILIAACNTGMEINILLASLPSLI